MTLDIQLQRTRQQFKRVTGNNEIKGVLGDGNGTVNVAGQPGKVYVRLRKAENFSAPFIASTNGVIAIENNRPVTVTQKASGEYVVDGIDIGGFVAQGRNPLEAHSRDPQIDYFTNQSQITTLLCYTASTTAAPSMEVIVREGLIVRNGAATFFSGERVDLTTHVPGTASEHLFAVLLLDTSDSIEVQVSTSQSTGTPLDMTDISEAIANASAGAIPVWAWKLENGQTSVPSSNDNIDLRQFVNPHGATFDSITIGDGSGDADLVIDGAAASLRTVTWQTNGSNRWMAGANSDLESGSDAGSNFNILNFDDSGSAIGNAVTITRSSGDFRIHNDLQVDNGAVFNEFGGDNDFRIEGDTDVNLFFVDASTDRIGIGTNTPDTLFHVAGAGHIDSKLTIGDGVGSEEIAIDGAAGSNRQLIFYSNNSPRWLVYTNSQAESGSDAGSWFGVGYYNDSGVFQGNVLTGLRTDGTFIFENTARFNGNLDHDGSNIGFFGTTPTSKKTVTGSRGGNAALASLLTQLAAYGFITDSTSA